MSNLNIDNPAVSADEPLSPELELIQLRAVSKMSAALGTLLDVASVTHEFVIKAQQLLDCERVILLLMNEEDAALEYGAISSPLTDTEKQTMLEMLFITTFNVMSDSPVSKLSQGSLQVMTAETLAGTRFEDVITLLSVPQVIACPLMVDARFIGVVVAYNPDNQDFTAEQQVILTAISQTVSVSLHNARRHSETVQELATTLHEMNILHQIDEELNDTIELRYVFRTILDWALRFTNAEVANLCLYDVVDDTLTMMAHYGYLENIIDTGERMPDHLGGIIRRVARAGLPEVVPDVTYDKDYVAIHGQTRTQMSVPILREERVIAVLSLESNKLNGFTDGHLSFVEKLAQRAGVAVDNARLFTETRREREKLTLIVRNIADVVMVVGMDEHIILINQAALLALELPLENRYIGHYFDEVIHDRSLQTFFRRARDNEDGATGEITLPNERTYHTSATLQKGTGWIIVLQDITHFKETDRLKTELVATVSHDLKQPLSVMRGYLDLLYMTSDGSERVQNYIKQLDTAFYSMRQLIDDLLDLAHIESGLDLALKDVHVSNLLTSCVEVLQQRAAQKNLTVTVDIPSHIQYVQADEARLRQIFNNLVGNAVKYTPDGGNIEINATTRRNYIYVSVIDDGPGISPDDQAKIFERFYRVRNEHTEDIDGTGLGLAIVKSLVEAHNGAIDIKSQPGEGSTFRVMLPVY